MSVECLSFSKPCKWHRLIDGGAAAAAAEYLTALTLGKVRWHLGGFQEAVFFEVLGFG